jgi:hypothetical protein
MKLTRLAIPSIGLDAGTRPQLGFATTVPIARQLAARAPHGQCTALPRLLDAASQEANSTVGKQLVWAIERKLAADVANPIISHWDGWLDR